MSDTYLNVKIVLFVAHKKIIPRSMSTKKVDVAATRRSWQLLNIQRKCVATATGKNIAVEQQVTAVVDRKASVAAAHHL